MDVKYPNGSVKKVRQAAVAPGVEEVTYMECGRNHALASGGHVMDGCGEWMPLGDHNPADASSYKCAACGCHRNFHRKVMMKRSPPPPPPMVATVLHGLPQRREETLEDQLPGVDSDTDSDGTEYDSDATEYDSEGTDRPLGELQIQRLTAQRLPATAPPPHGVISKRKRSRTMFTADQKLRMQELSEHLGWRLQKRDKDIIEARCHDIGVSKNVFRNWMNNKKRKRLPQLASEPSCVTTIQPLSATPWAKITSADEESWWIVKTRVGRWEAIEIGTTIRSDSRLAPKVVFHGVPLEIMTILTTKLTAKDTWDTLRTIRLGVAHVYEATLATLSRHYSDIRFINCEMVETLPCASQA
ncbi:zinc-finger homeodomain protein 9-like [Aegilops tauschii subsp. strangulata]|uniref:ZF-HD homeobox protein n=1 Tax=Aegilops tauschii TaxID=37682 RepID=M8BXC6_AEGTA|nr:zinc-finger homeodomain protein 9-like [Triticum aestivum]